jgi:hypothetical protein
MVDAMIPRWEVSYRVFGPDKSELGNARVRLLPFEECFDDLRMKSGAKVHRSVGLPTLAQGKNRTYPVVVYQAWMTYCGRSAGKLMQNIG